MSLRFLSDEESLSEKAKIMWNYTLHTEWAFDRLLSLWTGAEVRGIGRGMSPSFLLSYTEPKVILINGPPRLS
jgi:hypothetical protein